MPVIRRVGLDDVPRLVEGLDDVVRQRPLLEAVEVRVELVVRRDADDDAVAAAVLDAQLAVVHRPAQRRLDHGEARVRLDGPLHRLQRAERAVLEVPRPVGRRRRVLGAEPPVLDLVVLALDLAAEQAARDCVRLDPRDFIRLST